MSNLICSGQITREEALEELKKPLYNEKELLQDKEYVIKKLGFTAEEFEDLMSQESRAHDDFLVEGHLHEHYPMLKPLKAVSRLFR